jgi:hypothetical protein
MTRIWDTTHVSGVSRGCAYTTAVLVTGVADDPLLLLGRPGGGLLAAMIAPPGVDGTLRTVYAPHGIATPTDPTRAAERITRRLLPAYRTALRSVALPAVRRAHHHATRALAAWDAVSDQLCDEQGFPLDPAAYGARQAERDSTAWHHFETFLRFGPHALAAAAAATAHTAPSPATANRWQAQLHALTSALLVGHAVQQEWAARAATRHPGPGEPGGLAEARATDGWAPASEFITHGAVLTEIHQAADRTQPRLHAARPRRAPQPGTTPSGSPIPPLRPDTGPGRHR